MSLGLPEKVKVTTLKNCKGPSFYHVNEKGDQGPKQKCFVCGKQTSWNCAGCHEKNCLVAKVPTTALTETGKPPAPSLLKIKFAGLLRDEAYCASPRPEEVLFASVLFAQLH